MTSIKDHTIESDLEVGGATIKAVTDGEQEEDVQIIGHLISYTIGADFELPRDWLKRRMEELGLFIRAPGGERSLMMPPKVTAKSAFNRIRDRLIPELTASHPNFYGEGKREIEGRETLVETKKATNDEWHITAETFFSAEELGPDYTDGEFRQTTLGVMRYDKEHEGLVSVPKIKGSNPLWDSWSTIEEWAMKMFKTMQESHIGRDIQKMLRRFTHHWTDTIKVRDGGAVYFVPAGYDAEVRSLKTLIDEIDEQWKDRGRNCELLRISVTDSDEERKQIQQKASDHLETQIEEALEVAFSELAEDEVMAEEIADDLEDRLEELESFAGDYNAILSAKLSVQSALKDHLKVLGGEKEELVQTALEEGPVG